MQDRYTGDVGDFGKYGLVRVLCGMRESPSLRLGVVWYLVPDETHNDDGKYIRYLQSNYSEFRNCDSDLYGRLRHLLVNDSGEVIQKHRRVAEIKVLGILPSNTKFHCERLAYRKEMSRDERLSTRERWLKNALEKTASADLVFLDPDNGIECKSVRATHKKGPKYAFWDEIKSFADRGQSVVIYHHLGRVGSWEDQVERLRQKFKEQIPKAFKTSALIYKRGTGRAYFVAAASLKHQQILSSRLGKLLKHPWDKHFEDGSGV